jgi:hypothetical protein
MKRWAVSFLTSNSARTKQLAEANMPETLDVDGKQLQLNGIGLREATILNINVYVAGLYLEQRSSDASEILASESVKQVRLALLRDIPRADMTEQLGRSFQRAAGSAYERLKPCFERMAAWIPELHQGDIFSVTYRPVAGLEIGHGTRSLGSIPGVDFARVIFAIWLGNEPPNPALKRGMLGDLER